MKFEGAPRAALPDEEKIIGGLRYCAGFLRRNTERKGSQRRVLMLLREHGSMTQRDLLERMEVRPSSLSELLGKLESHGWVVKEKSAADKRNYDVALTPDGLRALEELEAQNCAAASELLSCLEPEERARLAALLEKLSGAWRVRESEGGVSPRHGRGHREKP